MNQDKKGSKRKIVTTTRKKSGQTARRSPRKAVEQLPMLFGRENFKWMFIGLALIAAGLILMMGGSMPSPDVWDESIIYSHRRTTIAPFLILAGLILQFVAIFKK